MPGLEDTFRDAACAETLSDTALLRAMLRVEAALATASAQAGLFSVAHAQIISTVCQSLSFDANALAAAARHAGVLTIPLVRQLTDAVHAQSSEAAHWVHHGATSQDILDSAMVLCLREANAVLMHHVQRAGDASMRLADAHRNAPILARTLLQPAVPIPFGLKAANWLSLLTRSRVGLQHAVDAACLLQLGGAAGSMSVFGSLGPTIAHAMGQQLHLTVPDLPWHGARDQLVRLGTELAVLTGNAGKIARDVSLMMQPEVNEAQESLAAGRGGSSAMPHKRNPVGCLLALEAAQRTPALLSTLCTQLNSEHERGLGQWQSQFFTLRELLNACASALASIAEVLEGLQVNPSAMQTNIDRLHGLVYAENISTALTKTLGRAAAHALVQSLCTQVPEKYADLASAVRSHGPAMAALGDQSLEALCAPLARLGASETMISAACAAWREQKR